MKSLFITATDTDAGKTYFSSALVYALTNNSTQTKVAVFKPISAGCLRINDQWVNEDAQLLLAQANCQQTLSQVNPIAYKESIAPHIAAKLSDKLISIDVINNSYQDIKNHTNADIVVTEGAGGWRLPLGENSQGKKQFLSDFVKTNSIDVILVVNMKLGCLNHALLTYETIIADGLNCIAWVANCPEKMDFLEENIIELEQLLPIPKIAQLDYCTDIIQASNNINKAFLNTFTK